MKKLISLLCVAALMLTLALAAGCDSDSKSKSKKDDDDEESKPTTSQSESAPTLSNPTTSSDPAPTPTPTPSEDDEIEANIQAYIDENMARSGAPEIEGFVTDVYPEGKNIVFEFTAAEEISEEEAAQISGLETELKTNFTPAADQMRTEVEGLEIVVLRFYTIDGELLLEIEA